MGVILKQSIKGSVYTYAGAILGFVNTGLFLPKFFLKEQIGLISILFAVTLIFVQLGILGFPSVLTRLFPYFRNKEKKHNGILLIGLIVSTIGSLIILLLFFLFKDFIIEINIEKSRLFTEYINYLPFLIIFSIFFSLFDNYSKVLFDATIGFFLKDFLPRVFNLILIVLYIFDLISFDTFILGYAIAYILPVFILFAILVKKGQFYLGGFNKQLTKKLLPEMLKIGAFGIIGAFSGIAVMNIDKYMVTQYLGLDNLGVYTIAFYFGTLIIIPARAIRKISSIFLAEAWKKDDLITINDVYYKSTINQFVIGVFLFIGVWTNIDNIFKILPDYISGKYVILFIAFANVIDMFTGVSSNIISSSSKYKVMTYVVGIMMISVVATNMIFIPIWGLSGAAFASLISIFLTAAIRFLYLRFKFQLQPYNFTHFKIFLIGVVIFLLNYIIPVFDNYYIDILIRGSFVTITFGLLIYYSRVSLDINKVVNKFILKVRQIL